MDQRVSTLEAPSAPAPLDTPVSSARGGCVVPPELALFGAEASSTDVLNGRGRGVLGTALLPGKYFASSTRTVADASMWQVAATPINMAFGIADFPEDSRYRVLLTESMPRVFLLEMAALATFNMMDPDLSAEAINAMEVCKEVMNKPATVKSPPLAYTVQGAGPHFCPGGNPHFSPRVGYTSISMSQYTGYLGFVQIRELCLPGVCALHGSMVGGGVAYSLNCTERVGASTMSVSYGNLSRGAVPGMMLSRNVVETLGLAGAVDLYLTDGTLSSYAAMKGRYLTKLMSGNQSIKMEAVAIARRMAANPEAHRIPLLKPVLDTQRFAREIIGINLSAKSGVLFSNVKKKAAAADQQHQTQKEQPPEPMQNEWEVRRARPKRRPKARARRQ
mmetsp:Transcript_5680/g.16064  ORF Transcript_5680/g.16064 Transcript_5680/m.16064 type:complete len:390 (+) Transcript_5680:26-1195(+)|eukprot:CAMPEP_0170234340 /NCGR_PEP_ID=MMETSP0116_2-20130129/16917_1 /TAXON_ID=400756 /ORGANISM="Durinskia baltica, Strain CSIRO CS-38" /LENGTH=389 /DNA_ID=CAMNT_0010485137 /DNA_START=25 /DNA_END=1194 /DNA_ORIENTATION=+